MNQERTLTFGKYKGTHRSNITGGFSAGDFGGLIYSIEISMKVNMSLTNK